jgi:hypothetical protein
VAVRWTVVILSAAGLAAIVGLVGSHLWTSPASVTAIRGEVAKVTWGESEEVAGGDRLIPFRVTSTTGISVRGLLRLGPLPAGEAGSLDDSRGGSPSHQYLYLILGGLVTGANAARLVDLPDGSALAALDYPYAGPFRFASAWQALSKLPAMITAARSTPAAVSLGVRALADHPELAGASTTLIGASFGSPFVILAAPETRCDRIALLHGFADVGFMLERAIAGASWPAPARWGLGRLARALARPYEPADHLERLPPEMPLLLVNSFEDELVPRPCIESLHRAAGSRATIHVIEGGHVRPDREERISELVALVLAWAADTRHAPPAGPDASRSLR